MSTARIILLPGMGIDERLFSEQRAAFPGLEVPLWLPPLAGETLESYAQRMAAALRIEPGERYHIGGASFGGMLALEMARVLKPAGVFLIASCRSSACIAGHARWMERIGRFLPDALIHGGERTLPLMFPDLRHMAAPRRELFFDMTRRTPIAFLRWSARAIFNWRPKSDPDVPIHHIHGAKDRLIPASRVRADYLVPDVGHLVTLSRPEEVNRFIAARL